MHVFSLVRSQVSLMDAITETALSSRPYRYKPSMTRRPNQQLKWLLPLVVAGQVGAVKESCVSTRCCASQALAGICRPPSSYLLMCSSFSLPDVQYVFWTKFIQPRLESDRKRQVQTRPG